MLSYLYKSKDETAEPLLVGACALTCLEWISTEPFWLPFSVSLLTNIFEMAVHILKDSLWVQTNRKITDPLGNQSDVLSLVNSACYKENHIKVFTLS